MVMTQTAFRIRPALNRRRTAAASEEKSAEIPLFQALLRLSSAKVTDRHCIKDTTMIDDTCGTADSLTNTNNDRIVKVERGNAKYMEVNE